MSTVQIHLIWAVVEQESDAPWLVGAWDEFSVDGNYDGYLEALAEARREHGMGNVRETTITADYGKVQSAFKPVDVSLDQENEA